MKDFINFYQLSELTINKNLVIQGIPGSGKTVIMLKLLDNLKYYYDYILIISTKNNDKNNIFRYLMINDSKELDINEELIELRNINHIFLVPNEDAFFHSCNLILNELPHLNQ